MPKNSEPYYEDEFVTLYMGDCLEVREWLEADVLCTDPPYGRDWHQGSGLTNGDGKGRGSVAHEGIAGDKDTRARDAALKLWGDRPGVVFGDPLVAQAANSVQALAYIKPLDAGIKGARAGFRRDIELIYLVGAWPSGVGGDSSAIRTGGLVAGPRGIATRAGHPHAKPIDVMEQLIQRTEGVIADPFAGSGSTLLAARNQGRRVIGVEIHEPYCELIAKRLERTPLSMFELSERTWGTD